MILPLVVSSRDALKFFHICVIKVLVNRTRQMLRDTVQIYTIDSWLIIVLTEACIEISDDADGSLFRVLDRMDFARSDQMCTVPHRERLVDLVVHSLCPIELGEAAHGHEIVSEILASSLELVINTNFVDSGEIKLRQLQICLHGQRHRGITIKRRRDAVGSQGVRLMASRSISNQWGLVSLLVNHLNRLDKIGCQLLIEVSLVCLDISIGQWFVSRRDRCLSEPKLFLGLIFSLFLGTLIVTHLAHRQIKGLVPVCVVSASVIGHGVLKSLLENIWATSFIHLRNSLRTHLRHSLGRIRLSVALHFPLKFPIENLLIIGVVVKHQCIQTLQFDWSLRRG